MGRIKECSKCKKIGRWQNEECSGCRGKKAQHELTKSPYRERNYLWVKPRGPRSKKQIPQLNEVSYPEIDKLKRYE